MKRLGEFLHTPTPRAATGRAATGVSDRSPSGVGVPSDANGADSTQSSERPAAAPDGHSVPAPIEEIYARNTISRSKFDALLRSSQSNIGGGHGTQKARVEAPAYIERLAVRGGPIPEACQKWVSCNRAGETQWAWIKSSPVEQGMAVAQRMVEACERDGLVGRLARLSSQCRCAPLYGTGSKEAVVSDWASRPILALAISHADGLDRDTLGALSLLVRRRRDDLLPTLFISDVSGSTLFNANGRPKDEAAACREIAEAIAEGLTGFDEGGDPGLLAVDLDGAPAPPPEAAHGRH